MFYCKLEDMCADKVCQTNILNKAFGDNIVKKPKLNYSENVLKFQLINMSKYNKVYFPLGLQIVTYNFLAID